jgi:hypothetical protein
MDPTLSPFSFGGMGTEMNDNQPITAEEHERFARFTSHQARFRERSMLGWLLPLDGGALWSAIHCR